MLFSNLDNGFYGVVNTFQPDSLRVINSKQKQLFDQIDGRLTVAELANKLIFEQDNLKLALDGFNASGLIRYQNQFPEPSAELATSTLNLWVHTTNKCNLSCNYCYISTLNETGGMSKAIQDKFLKKLVDTARVRRLTNIKLRLAGGEPLTQFAQWKSFILNAKNDLSEIGCTFGVSFITNLTILNDEMIEFCKAEDIGFGVSLDGLYSYHDNTRKLHSGKGTFETVDKNLNRLIENGIRVSTSTVVSNENMAGLAELTAYLIERDLPFRFSIVKGVDINRQQLTKNLLAAYKVMEDAINKGWDFSRKHKFCDLKPNELGTQTCSSGFSGGAVYVDGGIYYCHVQFGQKENATGTIADENIDLLSMIETGMHFEGMKSVDCQSCKYKYICTSGCPMYRIDGKDPNCGIYHEIIPLVYRLQAKEKLLRIINHYN